MQESETGKAWPPPCPGKRPFQPGRKWADLGLCCWCRWRVLRGRREDRRCSHGQGQAPQGRCEAARQVTQVWLQKRGSHRTANHLLRGGPKGWPSFPPTPFPAPKAQNACLSSHSRSTEHPAPAGIFTPLPFSSYIGDLLHLPPSASSSSPPQPPR